MRTHKYKVWNRELKIMSLPFTLFTGWPFSWEIVFPVDPNAGLEEGDIAVKDGQFDVVEFVGVYDKTAWEDLLDFEQQQWLKSSNQKEDWLGREIYTGDILQFTMPVNGKKYIVNEIVKYDDACAGFWPFSGIIDSADPNKVLKGKDVKLIGDIYHNPDMVEGK